MSLIVRRIRRTTINVVPLIDVMVVLVFFLLLTMHFGDTRALNIVPPAAESSSAASLAQAVVVAVDAEGKFYIDARLVAQNALAVEIKKALAGRKDPEVVVVADERVRTGATIAAVDAAAQAGARVRMQARAGR
jgi:biopolymer transport protein ExbD